ncbi:hypothetical protein K1719_001773 [Acacia pycnantha]|nr:hypothetical protein K1719_001773 [Acacia pycnantha]
MVLIVYPIGRAKNSKLVQKVQGDTVWTTRLLEFADDEDEVTVAAVAASLWECSARPIFRYHFSVRSHNHSVMRLPPKYEEARGNEAITGQFSRTSDSLPMEENLAKSGH